PNEPTWPGIDTFAGEIFHTAQWNHEVDLTGKRVAVVGVGSSSVQIVPAIQPYVEKVFVFQREPGWILPQGRKEFSEAELRQRARPTYIRWLRFWAAARIQWNNTFGPIYYLNSKRNRRAEQIARDYIDRVFG